MPSIKCTAKLATRAGFKLALPSEDHPDDWHANIFVIDRRFYVIFCHDRTRLSCLAGPVKKADLQDLQLLLKGAVCTVLEHEGFSDVTINYALSKINELTPAKTNNRSVLGTINDNIFHIELHANDAGGVERIGLQNLCAKVNHMPMSPLKWNFAIEEYRRSVIHSAS